MTDSTKTTALRTLCAFLAAGTIALACAACSPGGSDPSGSGDQKATTSSEGSSGNSAGDSDQSSQSGQSNQSSSTDSGASTGASATALCNDLQGADINGDSDEDNAEGIALWHKMIGDAPSEIKNSIQLVSQGLDKALAGDPTTAQSDDWQNALMNVANWEIANCING